MKPADFAPFFRLVYGYNPFPWQERLASDVITCGTWPPVLALPTSAGKTAAIDIAVFALACEADRPLQERCAPLRIFFVIDRRIVVDEAYARARFLAEKLGAALDEPSGLLGQVAKRLLALGGSVPLQVSAMRGGMYRDTTWARSPAQPTVCVSTVDQVGSRLLFRGYGLGSGVCNTRSIHAGLTGNDALIIVDEAHLSQPFHETLAALDRYRAWGDRSLPTPWQTVLLSATPAQGEHLFRDEAEDREHPVLGKRLTARKHASLAHVTCEAAKEKDPVERKRELEEKNRDVFVGEMCTQAMRLRGDLPNGSVVGIVVNRVGTARGVLDRLREQADADAILLTGRTRPHDRDRLLNRWLPRMKAGRDRSAQTDRPLFVVATQCIEVGADLDFDALMTECASLDALRQRFGRLDRLGELGDSRAVVVVRSDIAKAANDAVYGSALAATWKWLNSQLTVRGRGKTKESFVDFGFAALAERLPEGEVLAKLCSPAPHAPVMLPAHLDMWVQTSPEPAPDPDVALFLHGPTSGSPDVQVVWRGDVVEGQEADWADVVALVPPSSGEAMPVPLYAARAWLAKLDGADAADQIADVEGTEDPELESAPRTSRSVLRWRGLGQREIIRAAELRPGDTIVVPSTYGGADEFGWNPASSTPVLDIGDAVSMRQRSTAILRIHPTVISEWLPNAPVGSSNALSAAVWRLIDSIDTDEEVGESDVLGAISDSLEVAESVRQAAAVLAADHRRRHIIYPDRRGLAFIGSRRLPFAANALIDTERIVLFTDEDDTSCMTGKVTLSEHSHGVESLAWQFATACGLPNDIIDDLALSAWLHDVGKADPRLQVMLHGGDEVAAAVADEPLAKSGMNPRNRGSFRLARARSCYPDGGRHECQSLALIAANDEALRGAHDRDLVLHLVSSHHGCGRPFMPVVNDLCPVDVSVRHGDNQLAASSAHRLERLDSGVPDRFWRLVRRYGWYGLAYLEAILRLADHRRSEEEEEARG